MADRVASIWQMFSAVVGGHAPIAPAEAQTGPTRVFAGRWEHPAMGVSVEPALVPDGRRPGAVEERGVPALGPVGEHASREYVEEAYVVVKAVLSSRPSSPRSCPKV